jgi:hypothetical protein
LLSHQVDMHTPSLKFEEDMQFPKVIIVKQFLEKLLSLKRGLYSSVWKCGLNWPQLILKNFRLSLKVHNPQEFKNSKFQIDLK